jgi:hypothetical protein
MTRTALAKWGELYERFDPQEEGVDLEAMTALRPQSPANEIARMILRPLKAPNYLLLGTTGTGKTTELLRVARQCSQSKKRFVIFLNLVEHFDQVVQSSTALEKIEPWELCFLAGLAIIKASNQEFGRNIFKPDHLNRVAAAWSQLAKASGMIEKEEVIDLGSLAKSMLLKVSKFLPGEEFTGDLIESISDTAFSWKAPIGKTLKKISEQEVPVHALVDGINDLIGEVQVQYKGLLLVIDGLDRIRDPERAEELFRYSDLIGRLICPLVICGPVSLHQGGSTPVVKGFKSMLLFNEPVLSQQDPKEYGDGIDFFLEVYRRRVDNDCLDLIPARHLKLLAYYSGGRVRGFIKLIQELASHMYDLFSPSAPVPPPTNEQSTDDVVMKVIDKERRLLEGGLNRDDIKLMEEVIADPDHILPSDPLALKLLNSERLFPYPDGTEWFYPHPLLTINLLKPRAGVKALE